jgi:hypothetical protein
MLLATSGVLMLLLTALLLYSVVLKLLLWLTSVYLKWLKILSTTVTNKVSL